MKRIAVLVCVVIGVVLGARASASECGLAAGAHLERQISFDGQLRSYAVVVPRGCDTQHPLALLLELHGWDPCPKPDSAVQFAERFGAFADERRVVVARPVGHAGPEVVGGCGPSFNWRIGAAYDVILDQYREGEPFPSDDVGFLRAVVADLESLLPIDARRIHAYGESMGGAMVHRAACDAADLFAAVAATAFPLQEDDLPCQPVRPISVLYLHGIEDDFVWYDPAADRAKGFQRPCDNHFLPANLSLCDQGRAPVSFARWAELNGCAGEPIRRFDHGRTHCDLHASCDGGVSVEFCSVDGGHGVYENPDGLDREYVWEFLSLPVPEPPAAVAACVSLGVLVAMARFSAQTA